MTLGHPRELSSTPGARYTVRVSSQDEAGDIAYDGPHEVVLH